MKLTIFQLFASEDESLLVRRDAFFVLDLGLDVIDGVRSLNFESDGFSGEGFDKDLHVWLMNEFSIHF